MVEQFNNSYLTRLVHAHRLEAIAIMMQELIYTLEERSTNIEETRNSDAYKLISDTYVNTVREAKKLANQDLP